MQAVRHDDDVVWTARLESSGKNKHMFIGLVRHQKSLSSFLFLKKRTKS